MRFTRILLRKSERDPVGFGHTAPHEITFRRLYLYDMCTIVTERARTCRAGHDPGQVEYGYAVEESRHVRPCCNCWLIGGWFIGGR